MKTFVTLRELWSAWMHVRAMRKETIKVAVATMSEVGRHGV